MLARIPLVLLILLQFCAEFQCNHQQQRLECLKEVGVDLETIQNYRGGKGGDKPTEKILCFIKCTFEKAQILKSDGSIDLDRLKSSHIMDHSDDEKQKVYDCVAKLPPIHQCDDIVELQDCFNTTKQ